MTWPLLEIYANFSEDMTNLCFVVYFTAFIISSDYIVSNETVISER
jgi:hypothetical protein